MSTAKILRALAILAIGALAATGARASEDTVLSFSAGGVQRDYSLEDLRGMPMRSIETTTIWTEGPQRFEGVSLHEFLGSAGLTEGTIRATAINDYSVDIPVSDATENGPIIAYSRNGEEMSRRGKGPLWIVYPYDSDPKFQTETYFSRSIWQLDRLSVE